MIIENLNAIVTTASGDFIAGILLRPAIEKAMKLFADLAYLQVQQIALIGWDNIYGIISSEYQKESFYTFVNASKMIDGDKVEIAINKFWYSYYKQHVNWIHSVL